MKSTKKALVLSLLSMLLCVSMLIGTTFAWFTDTATSTNNRIVAGNLDVDLLMDKVGNGTYTTIAGGSGDIFSEAVNANDTSASLWEPGKTQVVYLAVKNAGNLALKYNILLDVKDEDTTDNVNLADVLDFAIIDGAKTPGDVYTNWADVTSATTQTGVIGEAMKAATDPVPTTTPYNARITAASGGVLDEIRNGTKDETDYFVLAVHMKEDAGNEYQGKSIVIDISIVATQLNAESDSFDNQYDKDAKFPIVSVAAATMSKTLETGESLAIRTTGEIKGASVPAAAANNVFESMVAAANEALNLGTGESADSYDLTLKLNVTKIKEEVTTGTASVDLEIDMDAIMKTTQNGTATTNSEKIESFGDEYVTIQYQLQENLDNVNATHKGNSMVNSTDTADDNGNGIFNYDRTTGVLTIKTRSLSPFAVTFDAVAQIVGGKYYSSLKNAIDAAQDGDTVVLLDNTSLSSGTTISEAVVIDLNNYTLTVSKSITANADFTVKNGKYSTSSYINGNNAAIKFEEVEIDRSINSSSQMFQLYGRSNLSIEVNGCSLTYTGTPSGSVYNGAIVGFTGSDTNCSVSFIESTIDWTENVPWVTFASGTNTCYVVFDQATMDIDADSGRVISHSTTYNIRQTDEAGSYKFQPVTAQKWVDVVTEKPDDYVVDDNGNISIGSDEAFAWFAKQASSSNFAGKTVTLTADLNMSGYDWTPIYCSDDGHFVGTFDGGNHTIKNIVSKDPAVSGYGNGIFYSVIGTVKNLNVTKATIGTDSNNYNIGGVITGYAYGQAKFENISVSDSIVYGYGKVGSIAGMSDANTSITFTDCSVTNTTIDGCYNCGGLLGLAQGEVTIERCTAQAVWERQIDKEYVERTVNDVTGLYWIYSDEYYYAAWGDYYTDYTDVKDDNITYIGLCYNK